MTEQERFKNELKKNNQNTMDYYYLLNCNDSNYGRL